MVVLTLAGAEGEHGWLSLACRTSSHHEHFIETGWLQLRQPQGFLTARDTDCMPAPYHCPHVIDLPNRQTSNHTQTNVTAELKMTTRKTKSTVGL